MTGTKPVEETMEETVNYTTLTSMLNKSKAFNF